MSNCPYKVDCPYQKTCIKCDRVICDHDEKKIDCIPLRCWSCNKTTIQKGRHELLKEDRLIDGKWKSFCSTECYNYYKDYLNRKL